ncbi:MAG TPA: DUF2268 domain-containing putative Zn-dependent protease [Cyclobacteriaceae bacterium]|nr:DUF2268 domain-containing putative Zn-dependent protease [Cyclobacteriaceae bacterium]
MIQKFFKKEYINIGSKGLKGFIKFRIEDGKNLSKTIKSNLDYYQSIRESSFLIDQKRERFYECFRGLKKIYSKAVFPDVYFVIGAKNSGGTTFKEGLILGAEMFGKTTNTFSPVLDIDYIDEVVTHELIHFQQNYASNNSLLAQCIREGSADFICELIAGDHSNKKIYEYGDAHEQELWEEFLTLKDNSSSNWGNWLYSFKDKSRPKDLGYWMGYQITQAYYNGMNDKQEAIHDILNITDFNTFLKKSGYNGK